MATILSPLVVDFDELAVVDPVECLPLGKLRACDKQGHLLSEDGQEGRSQAVEDKKKAKETWINSPDKGLGGVRDAVEYEQSCGYFVEKKYFVVAIAEIVILVPSLLHHVIYDLEFKAD